MFEHGSFVSFFSVIFGLFLFLTMCFLACVVAGLAIRYVLTKRKKPMPNVDLSDGLDAKEAEILTQWLKEQRMTQQHNSLRQKLAQILAPPPLDS